MAANNEGEYKVLATAHCILQNLGRNLSDTDTRDMLSTFSSFDPRFSNLSSFVPYVENQSPSTSESNLRLNKAEQIILNEADSSCSVPDGYLAAVDDIIQSIEELNLASGSDTDDVMERAENALQHAMTRLEDVFYHILIKNTLTLDLDCLERIELIQPDAVIKLRDIADRMIRSGYQKECCHVYCSVRRDVLKESMAILGIEKLSIEEVHRIKWKALEDKIKKWIQAVKVVVMGLLASEKMLCEQIFSVSDSIKELCFLETSKSCVMQLLNFGGAISLSKRSVEKLFRFLDMYETLAGVLPYLENLFNMDDDMVCSETKAVIYELGVAVTKTYVDFEGAVKGDVSRKPIPNVGIHPLVEYVMSKSKLLVDNYSSATLNELLVMVESESEYTEGSPKADNMSPIARRMSALLNALQSNVEEKSSMYENTAMQYVFLMNNIHYIVQTVKNHTELRNLIGDNWIKRRRGLIRNYEREYLRSSWSIALAYLRDDGLSERAILKDRFKNFNACFADIYRIQSNWKVPDPQLRDELRLSINERVLPAYRSFMRFASYLESGKHPGKYIKHTPDDLENHLLNMFDGAYPI